MSHEKKGFYFLSLFEELPPFFSPPSAEDFLSVLLGDSDVSKVQADASKASQNSSVLAKNFILETSTSNGAECSEKGGSKSV